MSIARDTFTRALRRLAIASLLFAQLNACSPTGLVADTIAQTSLDRSGTDSFADANAKLPAVPDGYMRLYMYRSAMFHAMSSRPIVVVNNVPLVDDSKSSLWRSQTRLLPASIFVVDTPSPATLWLRNEGRDDVERKISLEAERARVWFVKWQVKWLDYYRLEAVTEEEAKGEINDLAFTGYVKL